MDRDDPRTRPIGWISPILAAVTLVGCGRPGPETFATPTSSLPGHKDTVVGLAFSPDGATLATWGRDGRLIAWDVDGRRERWDVAVPGANFVRLAYKPDGSELAVNESGAGVMIRDPATGAERPFRRDPARPEPAVGRYPVTIGWGVTYSPDGSTLAAGGSNGGEDGFVTLWRGAETEGKDVAPVRSPVTSVAYSPDGGTIALASLDRAVHLWDVAEAKERAILIGHVKPISGLAFAPDGAWLASSSFDRTVKLWDAATGRELATLAGHGDPVYGLAIRSDGRFLASGDAGGSILLWNLATREPIARLLASKNPVQALAFDPTGQTLASAGDGGTIALWTIPPTHPGQ